MENTYTKENAGRYSLETILSWVEEDNLRPTIAEELRKQPYGMSEEELKEQIKNDFYK